jgi:hypothetical protein
MGIGMVKWCKINPTECFIVSKNVDKTLKLWGTFQSNLLNLKHKNQYSSKRNDFNAIAKQGANMPEITRFYGIIIKLFFGDHPPPHFHAVYGEYNAVFDVETLKMIEGDLPNRAEKMVLEWGV